MSPTDTTLEQRPRLKPGLVPVWRDPKTLQLGLDPDQAVLLHGVPREIELIVRQLDGRHTVADLAGQVPANWLDWLLAELQEQRCFSEEQGRQEVRVRLVGQSPLLDQLAPALTEAGIVALRAGGRSRRPGRGNAPDSSDGGAGPGGAVHASERREGLDDGRARQTELAICAPAEIEPERELTDRLTLAGQPHLLLRRYPGQAVVGPFVVPGQTPCIRCTDLTRRRLDPAWPLVLAQLTRMKAEWDAVAAAWAVATTVAQVAAWQRGVPQTLGTSVEFTNDDGALRVRDWPIEGDCGCCWRSL